MKKTIFITGGSGFIGKNFREFAKNKYHLLFPTHDELDLLDSEKVVSYFMKHKIDVVLHCANLGGLRGEVLKENIIKDNLRIFFNILKNKNKFSKMIHLGSGAEYDKSVDLHEVAETDFGKRIPKDDYGFYKYICSRFIENSENIYCLRLFGVFGKYEDYKVRFISHMIIRYLMKKPLLMIQNARFDFVDVKDLLRIIDYFILNNPKNKFFNVGSGNRYELLDIAQKINELDDYSMKIVLRKKGYNKEYTCNNHKLISELNHFKFTPLPVSIGNLYGYYKKNMKKLHITNKVLSTH